MKIKILLTLLFAFCFSIVIAQEISYNITSSKTITVSSKESGNLIEKIGEDESSYYFLQASVHGFVQRIKYTILKFDKDLNFVLKKQIAIPHFINHVFLIDDRLIILYNDYLKETKKHTISYESINKRTLELNNDKQKICTYVEASIKHYGHTTNKIVFSEDKSHFVIFSTSRTMQQKPLSFSFRIFSNEFNLVGENQNLKPIFSHGTLAYQNIRLANDGSLFLISKIRYKSDEQSSKIKVSESSRSDYYSYENEKGRYQVYYYASDGQLIEYVNLDLGDKTIRDVNVSRKMDGKIYCYGIYTGIGRISSEGSFISQLNLKTGKIINIDLFKFDVGLITQGLDKEELDIFNKNKKKTDEWEGYSYEIGDLLQTTQGNYYFIAEQILNGRRTGSSGSFSIQLIKDLYITYIEDNEINEVKKIKKRQFSVGNSNYHSYSHFLINDDLYFLFNDVKVSKYSSYTINTKLQLLDDSGIEKVSKVHIYKSNNDIAPMPTSSFFIDNDTIIYFETSSNYRKYKLSKLVVKY